MCKGNFISFIASVSLCGMFTIAACHSGTSGSDARAASIPSARVARAQRGNISHMLTLAGQFQPYQVVDVHPKVSGYMRQINVDIGDIVHEGQTLAVLEVPELRRSCSRRFSRWIRARRKSLRPSMRLAAPSPRTRLFTLHMRGSRKPPRGIPA